MKKACILLTAVLLTLVSLVTSCSKKEDLTVATVGGEEIKWGEFRQGYLTSPQFRRFKEDSAAKHDYLTKLIQEKLMIKEAYRQGFDQREEIKKKVEETETGLILNELVEREIVDKLISESEIRDVYDHSAEEVRARHILIKAPPDASPEAREKARAKIDSLHALLAEGHDFAMLAEEHSEDPGSGAKGGDLGFFKWGKMVEAFQQTAFALKPGKISDVVETQFGYHIIKVEEKREIDRKSYDEMKPQIRNDIKRMKNRELQARFQEFLEALKRENNLTFNEPAIEQLSLKKKQGNARLESLQDEEKSTVLASYNSGQTTMEDFLKWESSLPPKMQDRYRTADAANLKKLIEDKAVREFGVLKARELKLDKKEKIVERVRKQRDELMVRELNKAVEDSVVITEEDALAHFEQHRDEYIIPDQMNIQEIMVKDKAMAENLLKRIKGGADIAALAEQHSERKWAAKKGGEFGFFTQNQYGPIGDAAFKLKVGEFGGPITVQGGYSIFKVIGQQASRNQTYDEAKLIIEQKLETQRKEAAFLDLITSLENQTPIDINIEVMTMKAEKELPAEKNEQKG